MIYTLQFADDQVVMAQSKEDLEYICRKLQEEYSKWGLTMNIAKTKYMSLGTDTNYLEVTSLLTVPNISTWDPYLPGTEDTPKIYAIG